MKKQFPMAPSILMMLVAGAVLALLIIFYLPFRPTSYEAITEVMALKGSHLGALGIGFRVENLQITHIISEVPQAQLVIAAYDQVEKHAVSRCFTMRYVTKNLVLGSRNYSASGGCQTKSDDPSPILFHGNYERGTYALAGIATDENIAFIQAVWRDGTIEIVPVVNGAFLFFRRYDDLDVQSVIGLDAQMRRLNDTQVFSN